MPCHDFTDNVKIEYKKGHNHLYQREAERLAKRCHLLTTLLCKAGRARNNKTKIPVSVLNWWDEHCELDRKHGEPW